jgi:flagellar basal-body rod modification protein FlgD
MDGLQVNSITGPGSAAARAVATALAPRASTAQKATGGPARAMSAEGTSSSSSAATNSGAGGATITGNDFLTLLVSEMKNQDPTQPTDPNAYIQQLVGVNSLQQLIQINQGLSSIEQAPASTGTTTS